MIVRLLGKTEYLTTLSNMQSFTETRSNIQEDEIWITEHPAVYTLGVRDSSKHILNNNTIPKIQTDRGGLITYHGPGQLIIYPLLDLKKNKLKPTELVTKLENIVINTLKTFNIDVYANPKSRGVYTQSGEKIASIGLRIKRHCSYHGMAFNICMDLSPFLAIDPCGLSKQVMTDVQSQMQLWDAPQFFCVFFEILLKEFVRLSPTIRTVYDYDITTATTETTWPGQAFQNPHQS